MRPARRRAARPESGTATVADKTVAIFSLGGTIAMTTDPVTGGVVPALSPHDLLAAVPMLATTGIDLQVHDFRRMPGASLTFEDLAALSTAIKKAVDGGCDGAVVTQGTDTIEETAYLLDLLHDRNQPIAVTGAMRNPTLPGADGPANLYAAVITATGPELRGAGVVVVLGDEIHAARTVRKTHSTSPAAFTSPSTGPVGHLYEGRARIRGLLPARTVVPGSINAASTRVGLYTVTLGDDGTLVASMAEHCDGLVVAAFGVGHVPQAFVTVLEKTAAAMPVILTTRIGNGPVLQQTYSFPGSEKDLLSRGLLNGGNLDPYKARLLLHVLLAQGRSREEIADVFATAGT